MISLGFWPVSTMKEFCVGPSNDRSKGLRGVCAASARRLRGAGHSGTLLDLDKEGGKCL